MSDYQNVDDARWVERGTHSLAQSWAAIVQALGGPIEQHDDVWLADAASPNPFLNAATLTRPLQEDGAEALTGRLEAFFGQRPAGGPWLLWSGWPTPDLSRLGYVLWGHPPIMVRPPGGEAPPPPPELRIVEVRDAAELVAVERAFVEAYPVLGVESLLPGAVLGPGLLGGPLRLWGGYVGDDLVSMAAALVSDAMVDVCFVATQPPARQRGYGSALTWVATLADPTLPAVLEASDDGRPVYERMGYRQVGRMSLWERPRDPARPVYSPYVPPQA
jgi:hypothetical protein